MTWELHSSVNDSLARGPLAAGMERRGGEERGAGRARAEAASDPSPAPRLAVAAAASAEAAAAGLLGARGLVGVETLAVAFAALAADVAATALSEVSGGRDQPAARARRKAGRAAPRLGPVRLRL